MLFRSINDVHQLKGGILSYLANSKDKKLWEGECFVFDNRVSVKNELKDGTFQLCHACRAPLSKTQIKSKKYLKGLSCPKCYGKISEAKKKSLVDRNKQISIAKRKGLYSPFIKQTVSDL